MTQMNLFELADNRPTNVIDAVPALIRRICRDDARKALRAGETAQVIWLEGKAA